MNFALRESEIMKRWICKQAEWLVLGGYLLLVIIHILVAH